MADKTNEQLIKENAALQEKLKGSTTEAKKKVQAGTKAGIDWSRGFKNTAALVKANILEIDRFTVALGQSNAALALNAKAAYQVNERLMDLASANKEIGMTSDAANKIYNKLAQELHSKVRPGFDKTAGALVTQVQLWENLGVSTGETTTFINLFDTALGSSTNEIIKTGRVLHDFAARTGQDANQVFKDLSQSAEGFFDILDKGEMTKQMLTFQGRARSMGMSVSGVMGVLDKFETIDDAQTHGAKLNATLTALGGGFDSVKASALDYPERMDYIASTIQRVMPRIRKSSPRAQRLYMKSLRKSLGMKATDFRRLLQYKPGQMAAEQDLAAGKVTGITAGQEYAAARQMTTATALATAFKDAAAKGAIRVVLQSATGGVGSAEVTGVLKTYFATQASRVGDQISKVAEVIVGQFTGGEYGKVIQGFKNSMETTTAEFNTKHVAALGTMAKIATDYQTATTAAITKLK